MEINDVLQGARLVAHIITVAIVAGYCPDPDSAKRQGISCFAVLLAGGSAMMAVSTGLSWATWLVLPLAAHVALCFIFLLLLAPLIAGRGNVATLFPRRAMGNRQ